MEELLSQVHTAAGHYREAMDMDEDVLRLIVEADDGDDRTVDVVEPAMARHHLDLLKASYLRLKGWDKSAHNYQELVRDLLSMREHKSHVAFKCVGPAENWSPKDDPVSVRILVAPALLRFVGYLGVNRAGSGGAGAPLGVLGLKPRMGLKCTSSNWGLGLLHDLLHGGRDDEEEMEALRMATRQFCYQNGNGDGVRNGKV